MKSDRDNTGAGAAIARAPSSKRESSNVRALRARRSSNSGPSIRTCESDTLTRSRGQDAAVSTTVANIVLSEQEIVCITGGARFPGRQLEILHKNGFVRAWRPQGKGRVVLERSHFESICRGLYEVPEAIPGYRPPPEPDVSGLRALLRRGHSA